MWRWEKKKKQFSDKNLRSFHFGNQEKKVHLLKTFNQESGPIYQKKKKKNGLILQAMFQQELKLKRRIFTKLSFLVLYLLKPRKIGIFWNKTNPVQTEEAP